MKSAIFDLDLTLVDSSIAEEGRRMGRWQYVYSLIASFRLYDGMERVFDFIRDNSLKAAIVSSAPSSYVWRVIRHFEMPIDVVVGYHDAPRKPSPDGMIKALGLLGSDRSSAISFGDRSIDVVASKAAGIQSAACLWGTKEKAALIGAGPTYVISSPEEILSLLR